MAVSAADPGPNRGREAGRRGAVARGQRRWWTRGGGCGGVGGALGMRLGRVVEASGWRGAVV